MIDFWIITAHELFYEAIVEDKMSILDMPSVQISSLISEQQEDIIKMSLSSKCH